MAIRTLLSRARAKATLCLMSKGQKEKEISIDEIPSEWENFMGTKDEWINVGFPESEDVRACIYKAKKGSVFNPHKHKKSVEHIVITNRSGKIKVVTDTYMEVVSFPNTAFFEKSKPHAVEFLEDTTMLIMWNPKNEEAWQGDFLVVE